MPSPALLGHGGPPPPAPPPPPPPPALGGKYASFNVNAMFQSKTQEQRPTQSRVKLQPLSRGGVTKPTATGAAASPTTATAEGEAAAVHEPKDAVTDKQAAAPPATEAKPRTWGAVAAAAPAKPPAVLREADFPTLSAVADHPPEHAPRTGQAPNGHHHNSNNSTAAQAGMHMDSSALKTFANRPAAAAAATAADQARAQAAAQRQEEALRHSSVFRGVDGRLRPMVVKPEALREGFDKAGDTWVDDQEEMDYSQVPHFDDGDMPEDTSASSETKPAPPPPAKKSEPVNPWKLDQTRPVRTDPSPSAAHGDTFAHGHREREREREFDHDPYHDGPPRRVYDANTRNAPSSGTRLFDPHTGQMASAASTGPARKRRGEFDPDKYSDRSSSSNARDRDTTNRRDAPPKDREPPVAAPPKEAAVSPQTAGDLETLRKQKELMRLHALESVRRRKEEEERLEAERRARTAAKLKELDERKKREASAAAVDDGKAQPDASTPTAAAVATAPASSATDKPPAEDTATRQQAPVTILGSRKTSDHQASKPPGRDGKQPQSARPAEAARRAPSSDKSAADSKGDSSKATAAPVAAVPPPTVSFGSLSSVAADDALEQSRVVKWMSAPSEDDRASAMSADISISDAGIEAAVMFGSVPLHAATTSSVILPPAPADTDTATRSHPFARNEPAISVPFAQATASYQPLFGTTAEHPPTAVGAQPFASTSGAWWSGSTPARPSATLPAEKMRSDVSYHYSTATSAAARPDSTLPGASTWSTNASLSQQQQHATDLFASTQHALGTLFPASEVDRRSGVPIAKPVLPDQTISIASLPATASSAATWNGFVPPAFVPAAGPASVPQRPAASPVAQRPAGPSVRPKLPPQQIEQLTAGLTLAPLPIVPVHAVAPVPAPVSAAPAVPTAPNAESATAPTTAAHAASERQPSQDSPTGAQHRQQRSRRREFSNASNADAPVTGTGSAADRRVDRKPPHDNQARHAAATGERKFSRDAHDRPAFQGDRKPSRDGTERPGGFAGDRKQSRDGQERHSFHGGERKFSRDGHDRKWSQDADHASTKPSERKQSHDDHAPPADGAAHEQTSPQDGRRRGPRPDRTRSNDVKATEIASVERTSTQDADATAENGEPTAERTSSSKSARDGSKRPAPQQRRRTESGDAPPASVDFKAAGPAASPSTDTSASTTPPASDSPASQPPAARNPVGKQSRPPRPPGNERRQRTASDGTQPPPLQQQHQQQGPRGPRPPRGAGPSMRKPSPFPSATDSAPASAAPEKSP